MINRRYKDFPLYELVLRKTLSKIPFLVPSLEVLYAWDAYSVTFETDDDGDLSVEEIRIEIEPLVTVLVTQRYLGTDTTYVPLYTYTHVSCMKYAGIDEKDYFNDPNYPTDIEWEAYKLEFGKPSFRPQEVFNKLNENFYKKFEKSS